MGNSTYFEDGLKVRLTSDGLESGYDIASITLHGAEVPLSRKGEFETEEQAFEAAKQLAKDQPQTKAARR